jgi:hypothetical protein
MTFEAVIFGAGHVAAFVAKEAPTSVSDHCLELIANNAIRAANEVLHWRLVFF